MMKHLLSMLLVLCLTFGMALPASADPGALSIEELQRKARLTVVSSTSIVEGGSHDVILKNGPVIAQ